MINEARTGFLLSVKNETLFSHYLNRDVLIDAYLPNTESDFNNLSLLLLNDGQDLPVMPFADILSDLYSTNAIEPIICIGIHCGTDRKNEYGTAGQLNYKAQGAKAELYTNFILQELLPFVQKTFAIHTFKDKSFAGFSLGGLSALDIVFNHPHEFVNAASFSGSLWWRSRAYGRSYNDETDRIMHALVRRLPCYKWLSFFLECGALDELADRNNNGIIDSVEDTLDLITELKAKGYATNAIKYVELPDGMHNVATWALALPNYLQWRWGK